MNSEIQYLTKLYESAYEGDPWFGRCIKEILGEIDADTAAKKPNDQHSILELLYHMINWREFTISRLEKGSAKPAKIFGENDWQNLDHANKKLWEQGLRQLEETQKRIIEILSNLNPDVLTDQVSERKYDVRYLLYGILEHDIYHLGQIAYVKKLLEF